MSAGRTFVGLCGPLTLTNWPGGTLIQLEPTGTTVAEILRAWISQENLASRASAAAGLVRKSVSGSGTPVTPSGLSSVQDSSASTVHTNLTTEGTNGLVLVREAVDSLKGWLYVPQPGERILARNGQAVGLHVPTNIVGPLTISAGLIWAER